MRFHFWAPIILSAVGQAGVATAAPSGDYAVSFSEQLYGEARVEARFEGPVRSVSMAGWGASQFPRGWGQFVRNLRASNCAGTAVELAEVADKAEWTLARPVNRLCLSYRVDLSFTRSPWPFGAEQAGAFADNTLYLVSKALFIGPEDAEAIRVRFNAPGGYSAISPFPIDTRNPGRHLVPTTMVLRQSSLVVSARPPIRASSANFDFLLVLVGDKARDRAEVERVVHGVVPIYAGMFPSAVRRRYLMTIMSAASPDAEAFLDSAALTDPLPFSPAALPAWGNEIAHEIFHAWNAGFGGTDPETSQWFSEGVTEYFANRSLLRAGLVTPEQFWSKAASEIGFYRLFLYSPAFDGMSVHQAGTNKGKYRLGVYNGGWAVAFALDRLIHEHTNGASDLDDVMIALQARRGANPRPIGLPEIVAAVKCVTGDNVWDDFFNRHVIGVEPLPLDTIAARLGFELRVSAHDGRAWLLPGASGAEANRRAFEHPSSARARMRTNCAV